MGFMKGEAFASGEQNKHTAVLPQADRLIDHLHSTTILPHPHPRPHSIVSSAF